MGLMRTIRTLRMFRTMFGKLPFGHLWYLFRQMSHERPHIFNGQIRVNTFFPPYPSVQFDRFCQHIIARSRVPFSTYLAVTGDCPDSCAHCSYGHREAAELSTEQWIDIIGQLAELGVCTIGFTGGEPLLRDDIVELVTAASEKMSTILFTAGSGLNDELAGRLAGAGITCVTVGFESNSRQVHDDVREREGSYDEAVAAVEACRRAGIYTAISTIAFDDKVADGTLDRMYKMAEEWGIGEFRILSPVPTGSAAGNSEVVASGDTLDRVKEFHRAHNRRRTGPIVASFASLESPEKFGCGAGYHHLFVDSGGEVCPCDLTPMSFGNAASESIVEIWERMGGYFPFPRCDCVMKEMLNEIDSSTQLPLPREVSEQICPPRPSDDSLPGCYCRLFERLSEKQD